MDEVEIYNNEPRAGTFLISQGFNRQHRIIIELIENYKEDFREFGSFKRRKQAATGGRAANEYLLNENQAMFLGTLLRNNAQTVKFKKELIKAFDRCRKQLEAIQKHKTKPDYQISRDAGKIVRKNTTDTMQRFVEYAKSQGSQNAERYYSNISRMLNGLLFIVQGKYKNLREVMTIHQLMTVSSAEQIIDRGLLDGMSHKKYYKDIYKSVRERVELFAELHGQSEIIVKQLEDKEDGR